MIAREAPRKGAPLKLAAALALGLSATLAAGCASSQGGNVYKSGEVGQVERSEEGVIVSSRAVTIQGREGYLGAVTGAVMPAIYTSST